jgi:hypothetical protein
VLCSIRVLALKRTNRQLATAPLYAAVENKNEERVTNLRISTAKMSGSIIRVTLFKIPSKESQEKMAENYRTLSKNALKVSSIPSHFIPAPPAHPC